MRILLSFTVVCGIAAFLLPAIAAAQDGGAMNAGIGDIVSGWTHEGIHGTELADRVHQLIAERRALRGKQFKVPGERGRPFSDEGFDNKQRGKGPNKDIPGRGTRGGPPAGKGPAFKGQGKGPAIKKGPPSFRGKGRGGFGRGRGR